MNYWETETPVVANTGANVLRYYPDAGKLQINLPDWLDKNGETKSGKTVTVDTTALRGCKSAIDVLKAVIGK